MELITVNSEDRLVDLLTVIEPDSASWVNVHVHIRRIGDQMLEKESLSAEILEEIEKISARVAKTLMESKLGACEGAVFLFEDTDVLALVKKDRNFSVQTLDKLRSEFTVSGLLSILSITEMKEQLANLIQFSQEKKKSAEVYRLKRRAVKAAESIFTWARPDQELTYAIQKKRRQRPGACVLVVEDDVVARGLVAMSLRQKYEVALAKDAKSGVISYIDKAPDIVFLDIHLPDHNGHDVLKRLKMLDPHAYVVMLSGDSVTGNVLAAKSEGAIGFIRKPFSKEKMMTYINKCPSLMAQQGIAAP
jgi:two-component system, chemotaxis family, chemotaxis protein CheY